MKVSDDILDDLADVEEDIFLLKRKLLDLIKFASGLDAKLEKIANDVYYEGDLDE